MNLNGPGKYDAICTKAREEAQSALTALIIIGGKYGMGFSVQCTDLELLKRLPDILETMAKDIRKQTK